MTIKEAELLSGVSSRNIRFYEQKGLLKPARNEGNDYREYSDEDIQSLMLIRVLRMLDMPLEQIREVMEGKVSLRIAASRQAEHLKRQIKKMEIAATFCEELAGTDAPDVQALLTRMDEPENREMLSHKWPADYKETLQTAAMALACGLLPVVLGFVLPLPVLVAMLIHESAAMVLSLVPLVIWAYLGFSFRRRGRWWLSLVLAHLIPAVLCVLIQWQMWLPAEQRIDFILEIRHALECFLMYFTTVTELIQGIWPILLELVGCFCLGGLAAWAAPIFELGWNQAYGNSAMAKRWKKLEEKMPVKLILLYVLILAAVFAVTISVLFGPLDGAVTPETVQQRLTSPDTVWVKTPEQSWEITGSAEFSERFRFHRWERQYFSTATGEPALEVYLNSDYAIAFYSNGTARIYEAWITLEEGYFRVPEGIAEAVLEYAQVFGNTE